MPAVPLHFQPATELARLLRSGKISAQALLEQCLDQYAKHNGAAERRRGDGHQPAPRRPPPRQTAG